MDLPLDSSLDPRLCSAFVSTLRPESFLGVEPLDTDLLPDLTLGELLLEPEALFPSAGLLFFT